MRVCIVGAGAIGGLLGVRLAVSGQQVSVLARGDNLAAIRSHGMRLEGPDGSVLVATDLKAIETEIGKIARPKNVWIVPDMPKTRSGKIMRRVIAAISNIADV